MILDRGVNICSSVQKLQYHLNISISLQYFNISSIFQYLFNIPMSLHPLSTIQKQHWHHRFSHRTTSLWQTAACRPTRRRSGSFLSLKSIFINIFLINIIIIRLSPRNLMEPSSSSSTNHLCLPGDIWEHISLICYISVPPRCSQVHWQQVSCSLCSRKSDEIIKYNIK